MLKHKMDFKRLVLSFQAIEMNMIKDDKSMNLIKQSNV